MAAGPKALSRLNTIHLSDTTEAHTSAARLSFHRKSLTEIEGERKRERKREMGTHRQTDTVALGSASLQTCTHSYVNLREEVSLSLQDFSCLLLLFNVYQFSSFTQMSNTFYAFLLMFIC